MVHIIEAALLRLLREGSGQAHTQKEESGHSSRNGLVFVWIADLIVLVYLKMHYCQGSWTNNYAYYILTPTLPPPNNPLHLLQQPHNKRHPNRPQQRQINRHLMLIREVDLPNHTLLKEAAFRLRLGHPRTGQRGAETALAEVGAGRREVREGCRDRGGDRGWDGDCREGFGEAG